MEKKEEAEFELNEQAAEMCEDMTWQEFRTAMYFQNELKQYHYWGGEK